MINNINGSNHEVLIDNLFIVPSMNEKEDWETQYVSGTTPWDVNRPDKELIRLIESGKVRPCQVLELGCGTGTNAVYLALKGFSVVAVDISKTALKRAREKARKLKASVDFINTDILCFHSKIKYDFIFDIGCFHYIATKSRSTYIQNLEQHLKASGVYFLSCFPFSISSYPPFGFSRSQIEKYFSNFEIIEFIKPSPFFSFDSYLNNYVMKKRPLI